MAVKIYRNDNPDDEFIKVKHRGKIYTPDYLVNVILDQGHYVNGNINKKHAIDNSCGDGQFMIHIVDRYCSDYIELHGNKKTLKKELETYIHAIDIELDELNTCKERCSQVASQYGIDNVNWDFICADSINCNKYDGKMDFVLGNPPYVRVHNLNESFNEVKNHIFCSDGMTDLFLVFYEISLKMLNETGILSYITPSSYFTSVAGGNMRKYFIDNKILESICDLKHFQAFNAMTYTQITVINKSKKFNKVTYYEFDNKKLKPYLVNKLESKDFYINNNFYFSTNENLDLLRKIIFHIGNTDIAVKNGYATLNDKIFIGDFKFKSKYIIPCLKASRGMWTKIIFPYDKNSKLVPIDLIKKDKELFEHFEKNKDELIKHSYCDPKLDYYQFGRTQGINDTFKNKLSINALIRKSSDLKLIDVPSGCGIYSGLYITSNDYSLEDIKKALYDEEFGIYISLLGKYKSGGYYTFSSKDVKYYLDYKLY